MRTGSTPLLHGRARRRRKLSPTRASGATSASQLWSSTSVLQRFIPSESKETLMSQRNDSAKAPRKVVIPCAVTGAIHPPSMSPYLPITPDEIAEAAIGAHEAGAAVVHLHARDPKDGRPDQRPE